MPREALLNDSTTIAVALMVGIGAIFLLAGQRRLAGLFRFVPAITWAYFIPMICTTAGVLPGSSPAYAWITHTLLPASLVLLIMTTDIPAIMRLGPKALAMMLAGSLGVVIGGPITLLIFQRWLPDEAWKGIGTPAGLLAPLIVVDTVVGYSWFGFLIYLSSFQDAIDRRFSFDRSIIDDLNARLDRIRIERGRPIAIRDLAFMLAASFGIGRLCLWSSEYLPELGRVVGPFTWTIILVTTVSMLLSFSPLRRLENAGASRLGYIGIYIVLASIGARADMRAVLDTPVFFAAGVVWILIHAAVLVAAARLLRAPVFFFATGSMPISAARRPVP